MMTVAVTLSAFPKFIAELSLDSLRALTSFASKIIFGLSYWDFGKNVLEYHSS